MIVSPNPTTPPQQRLTALFVAWTVRLAIASTEEFEELNLFLEGHSDPFIRNLEHNHVDVLRVMQNLDCDLLVVGSVFDCVHEQVKQNLL